MKPHRSNLLLLGVISLTLAAPSAFSADLYWDTDGATAGAGGATPSGSWATNGTTWSTDPTGATATSALTTSALNNLFFSAGTDATGSYTVTLTGTQNAKSLTFEEGAATLTGGSLSLTSGGITVLAGSGNPTISSNLTISGGNTFDVGSGRTLTLGAPTRNSGATLNVQDSGTVVFTSGSLSNRIIGPWASFGTSASTSYATTDSTTGVVSALTYAATPSATQGTAVTSSTDISSTDGTVNYTLSAAGTLGADANVNTLRYTGASGNLTSNGTFTTKGVMNVSGNLLSMLKTWTSGSSDTEMVINAANGDIRVVGADASLTGAITKTGSGTFTLGAPAGSDYSGIGAITVNEGNFITNALTDNQLVGATINSGGTLSWAGNNKHMDSAVFTINAGGTLNIGTRHDTIGGITGAGTITGSSGYIQIAGTSSFNGNITGGIGIRTSATTSALTLSGASDYSGGTIINAGFLDLRNSTAAGSGTIQLGNTTGSDTAELRLNVTGTNPTNDLIVNPGSTGTKTLANRGSNSVIYAGNITADDNLTILGAYTGGRLTVSGTANTIATGKNVSFSNTGAGAANALIDSAIWSGDGSISYTSSNSIGFEIRGASTYSGGATLGAMSGTGIVEVQTSSTGPANAPTNGAFGTGTLSIGATKMRAGTTGDITIGNAVTFTDNPTFTTVANEKSLIFSGNASLGATRTLTVETGSTVAGMVVEFSGEISGDTFGITKEGAGTLILSGTNTYTGDTLVSAGTLYITGSLGSNVTLSNDATLGGGGSVDAITFNGGAFLEIFSTIDVSAALSATSISFATAGFGIESLRYNGAALDWTSIASGNYTLLTGNLDSSNLGNFELANAYIIGDGRHAYFTDGSLKLVVEAIPEPSTALLGALGLLALLRRRRN